MVTTSPFRTTFAAVSHARLTPVVVDGGGATIALSSLSVTYQIFPKESRVPLIAALAFSHAALIWAISSGESSQPKHTRAREVWKMLGTPPEAFGKAPPARIASNSRRVDSASVRDAGTGNQSRRSVPEGIMIMECASNSKASHSAANCLSDASSDASSASGANSPPGGSDDVAKSVMWRTASGVRKTSRLPATLALHWTKRSQISMVDAANLLVSSETPSGMITERPQKAAPTPMSSSVFFTSCVLMPPSHTLGT
mmetsp:Transcript_48713/g.157821  ORF Transcript_48713/g.157821 Transcript_48713/m.157821 type:complete len:256 (+) Transcript_48713:274-1041(+)